MRRAKPRLKGNIYADPLNLAKDGICRPAEPDYANMNRLLAMLGAGSCWGPFLVLSGLLGLATEATLIALWRLPTILEPLPESGFGSPRLGDRLSVHLVVYSVWAIAFGAIVWRGAPGGMIDPRLAFEKSWPVAQNAEWIYLSSYLVPFILPWLPVSRQALRRYSLNLWWLLVACGLLFLAIPAGAPPRPFKPTSLGGSILSWDISRSDFNAASLPSFHVCWALLSAALLASLGRAWSLIGHIWAAAVAASCLATGAHALVDVVAAFPVYWLVAGASSPVRRAIERAELWLLEKDVMDAE